MCTQYTNLGGVGVTIRYIWWIDIV
eukprot:COSAG01_NODE_50145_length_365_cov_15.308271_1_plen_24_part_10